MTTIWVTFGWVFLFFIIKIVIVGDVVGGECVIEIVIVDDVVSVECFYHFHYLIIKSRWYGGE